MTAQKDYCEFYGSKSSDQDDQQFFSKYEPLLFIPSVSEPKIATDIPIEELDFSVRSYNCLKRAGVNTIGDIIGLSCDDLMRVRNMGKRSLIEILSKLKDLGVPLNDDQKKLLSQSRAEIGQ